MTPDDMAKMAAELFEKGFHCSQATFYCGLKKLGIENGEDAIAALSPFGGGIASTGNTCGTILGAIGVIGYLYGKKRPEDKDGKLMWKLSHKLFKAFKEITAEYGGTNCKDIARVNWSNITEVKKFRTDPLSRRKECFKVIEKTARALGELLDQNQL